MPASVDIFHPSSSSGKQVAPTGELACLKGWSVVRAGDTDSHATATLNFKSGGSGGTTLFSYEAPINEGVVFSVQSARVGNPMEYMNVPGLGLQFDSGIYIDVVITATGGGVVDGFLIQTVYT